MRESQQPKDTMVREQSSRPTCIEVIGAVISVEVLGFWFGIGATLGAKMVKSLEELINRKC